MAEETTTKKIKLAPSEDEELDKKIAQQLEYYFSDVNVIKDKFLLEEFKKDDGWVKISVLLKFVRLKELSNDEDKIVSALKQFNSDIVELDEEKKQVRRKHPIPDADELKKQIELRTVHISGFPSDYSFENLRSYCNQFGEVESVAMRRHFKTRFFKGCIHAVFKNEASVKGILDLEILKCKDRELKKESMEQYHKRKEEFAKKRQEFRKKKGTAESAPAAPKHLLPV